LGGGQKFEQDIENSTPTPPTPPPYWALYFPSVTATFLLASYLVFLFLDLGGGISPMANRYFKMK
jgi:hypothetical protein